ncbi:hypothetical protein H6A65_00350 [Mediterraneibacter glycyrrhizinilyticus]|uniref:hypothetical protein n=1 Tax=Mediterraneibacter glycyrrhizinilyticus TaxID=342942 RepID=UPI0019605C48|nr:hypothetical protein [Mediterraneibacter glycyrrhizinilyticus]
MLRVEDLSKTYHTASREYPVLKHLSFQVAKGEFVAVMGPSGSGARVIIRPS